MSEKEILRFQKKRLAVIRAHQFSSQIKRIADTIMACYDPTTGGFKGYPV